MKQFLQLLSSVMLKTSFQTTNNKSIQLSCGRIKDKKINNAILERHVGLFGLGGGVHSTEWQSSYHQGGYVFTRVCLLVCLLPLPRRWYFFPIDVCLFVYERGCPKYAKYARCAPNRGERWGMGLVRAQYILKDPCSFSISCEIGHFG